MLAKPKELKAQKAQRLDRRNDIRITRLFERIGSVGPLDWVWFEDCQFLSTQLQSQLWASLRAAVWLHGRDGLQIDCVPVGTLKKFATGHGNATKEMMVAALPKGLGIASNDEADARHLLNFAKKKLNL